MGRKWFELAQRAQGAMSGDVPYGTAMARREEVAAQLGITRQTLRNYMSAYDFVRRIGASDPEAAVDLSLLPATAVEIYGRWHGRDPDRALAHARWAAANDAPVSVIAAAERDARTSRQAPSAPSLTERALASAGNARLARPAEAAPGTRNVRDAMQRVGSERPRLWELVAAVPDDGLAQAAGVAAVLELRPEERGARERMAHLPFHSLRRQSDRFPMVGVIEAAPTVLGDGHRRMGRLLLMRAIAVLPLYPLCAVLLPDRGACDDVVSTLPRFDSAAMGMPGAQPVVDLGDGCVLVSIAPSGGGILIAHADGFAVAYGA